MRISNGEGGTTSECNTRVRAAHPLSPSSDWHSSEKHTTRSRSLELSESPVLYDPYDSTLQKCHSLATERRRLVRMAS